MNVRQSDHIDDGNMPDPPPPSPEMIAARAYALWEERGRPRGEAEQNWLEAERELVQRARVPRNAATKRPPPDKRPRVERAGRRA